MKQLGFFDYSATQREMPGFSASWREGDVVVHVAAGPYCVDEAWPWWKPSDIRTWPNQERQRLDVR